MAIPKQIRAKIKEIFSENAETPQSEIVQILKDECEYPNPDDLLEAWYLKQAGSIAAHLRDSEGKRLAFTVHDDGGEVFIINTDISKDTTLIRRLYDSLERKATGIQKSRAHVRTRLTQLEGQRSLFSND